MFVQIVEEGLVLKQVCMDSQQQLVFIFNID